MPNKPIYDSSYQDKMSCYTTYQPLANPKLNLNNLVLLPSTPATATTTTTASTTASTTANNLKLLPFQRGIMEQFYTTKDILSKARSQGKYQYN